MPSVKRGNEQYGVSNFAYMGEVPVEQKENSPNHPYKENIN